MTEPGVPTIEVIENSLHRALKSWRKQGGKENDLLGYLQIVQSRREVLPHSSKPYNLRRVTNTLILEVIQELMTESEEDARVLTHRFVNDKTQREVGFSMNRSRDQIARIQQRAIKKASRILHTMEMAFRNQEATKMTAALPGWDYNPNKAHEDALANITGPLLAEQRPHIIVLTGIGGIGKTTLAEKAANLVIPSMVFKAVYWLKIEPPPETERRPNGEQVFQLLLSELSHEVFQEPAAPGRQAKQLSLYFNQNKCLVVIDNLERQEDLDLLVENLKAMGGPTKFLLTSRNRPANNLQVFSYAVKELDFEDTLSYLHYKQKISGFSEPLPRNQAKEIYSVVGGNPLALDLVLGLLRDLELGDVLEDLKQVGLASIDRMYRRVYWRAWKTLSSEAKKVLLAMPMATEAGGESDHLRSITRLENSDFMNAVMELSYRSLITTRGSTDRRRYQIHRLTETFLFTDVLGMEKPQ